MLRFRLLLVHTLLYIMQGEYINKNFPAHLQASLKVFQQQGQTKFCFFLLYTKDEYENRDNSFSFYFALIYI